MSSGKPHTISAPSAPLLDFYRWGFPTAPLQIHLSLEVVKGIRRQIQDSAEAPGAVSQCGLLIGIPQPRITKILDFEPLDTLDTAPLVLATRSASGEVVGFYRTTPAGGVSMSHEDRVLAAKFPQPSSVFLLIETMKSSIGNARFCFWGEGELFDWPVMMFPFVAEELASKEPQPHSSIVRKLSHGLHSGVAQMTADQQVGVAPEFTHRAVAPQTALHPVVASALPVAPPVDRQKSQAPATQSPRTTGRPWLAWVLLAAVLAVSLSLGAFWYFSPGYKLPVVPPPAAVSPRTEKILLGLAVERRGNGLLVSWNGDAPIVSKANFGMLLIRGSGVSRDVPLTTEELRAGGFVYTLAADEMKFQLNVVAGEQVAREFLTVVRPQTPQSPASLSSPAGGNSNPAALPAPPVLRKPVPQPLPEIRQFRTVDPPGSASAPPLRIDEPPAAGAAAPLNTGTLSLLNRPVFLPAPVDVSAREIPQSAPPPSPLLAEAHPPVAKRQVSPQVPALLRGRFWNATVVEVKVSVDASGSVVKAEAVPKPGLHPLLRDEAVQAARRWTFQPAQFNGHPVPAEVVVQFKFAASR